MNEAPIENPGTIGVVERYHAPLRAACLKIRSDMDNYNTDEECMRLAVFSINATVLPEGLFPILLVFGAIHRPARETPSPSQLARAQAIDSSMDEVEKTQARRRIDFVLKNTAGPKAVETSHDLRNLPAGQTVLVYRTKDKGSTGPHKFVSIDG